MIHKFTSETLPAFLSRLAPSPAENDWQAFDLLHAADMAKAPHRRPPLFGSRERLVGRPSQLFRRLSRGTRRPPGRRRTRQAWLGMVHDLKPFGVKGQIAGVNAYVNRASHVDHIAVYGKATRWAAPLRYFACADGSENYAIAKYMSLRFLGFHPERLRLVWLEGGTQGEAHAVLTVALDGRTVVLDSRSSDIRIGDHAERAMPYCSLNGRRFSVHWDPANPKSAKSVLGFLERSLGQEGASLLVAPT